MKSKNKITVEQRYLNQDLADAAEKGKLAEVKNLISRGADPNYVDAIGYNALYQAVEKNKIDVAKYLLDELNMGSDSKIVGMALAHALNSESIKLLAGYNLDFTAKVYDFAASDWMVFHKEYELLKVYDNCGLPRAPINKKVMRKIGRELDLQQLAAAFKIKFDERYSKKISEFNAIDIDQLQLGKNFRKKKNLYQSIRRMIIADEKTGKAAL